MRTPKIKKRFILWFLVAASLPVFFGGCDQTDATGSVGQIFEISSGQVQKIDDYPLYTLEYNLDYKFDQYLQNGLIPVVVNTEQKLADFACTCFSVFGEDNRLLARNYDWSESTTYFLVWTNPEDAYASVSTVDFGFFNYDHDKPPDFEGNQQLLETIPFFPFDGMNEKGVAIGMNAVPFANAPRNPAKVTIGELQLIRLVLDYAASTEEALDLIGNYNIRMEEPPIHYIIADAAGHSAIVEFVNGQKVIKRNTDSWQITTNFVIKGLLRHEDAPCWRYKTVWENLDHASGALTTEQAAGLLEDASVSGTRWSTVYDLNTGKFQVAMGRNYDHFYRFSVQYAQ